MSGILLACKVPYNNPNMQEKNGKYPFTNPYIIFHF